MSWAAHQFEVYAVQAHLPKKMIAKVSFWGIFLGDFTPDFLSKFWVYGFTINGTHYGAEIPEQWHRGFPGMGFTHTLFVGILLTSAFWIWKRNRAFAVGYLLGYAAHALTDINDSVGTMLLFPLTTSNWTSGTWAYAATVDGGKYLDAAAYYSSLGLAMDLFWLAVVLCSWRVLTREHWRTRVVPADARIWAWLSRFLPERGLIALYRATFFYGICRLISWSTWAHVVARPVIGGVERVGYPFDLSWTGPWWITAHPGRIGCPRGRLSHHIGAEHLHGVESQRFEKRHRAPITSNRIGFRSEASVRRQPLHPRPHSESRHRRPRRGRLGRTQTIRAHDTHHEDTEGARQG